MKRRTFVKSMAAASALSLVTPSKLFSSPKTKQLIGIQLYTLRDLVKQDFIGTLTKLAQIGYNSIEAAGYNEGKFYGYKPAEYKKVLLDLGLAPMSSHSGINPENAKKVAEDTLNAGMSYVILPWISEDRRTSIDTYKKLADDMNLIGEQCNQLGLRFGYHNHAFEFEEIDGQIPYDVLLNQTDADKVCMQLDLYWMVYGGYNPLDYFIKYPGRFELWHVKDMANNNKRESTEIGSGIIDFPALFNEKSLSGMQYYFVEQESFTIDPMESVEMSFNYLKTFNLTK